MWHFYLLMRQLGLETLVCVPRVGVYVGTKCSGVIKNSYMHRLMQKLELIYIPFSKKLHPKEPSNECK